MSSGYDAVIVGAGLGGLATASLLAQRGYRALVIDRHNNPGGYATNFQRNGFTFDVSLHSFDGVVRGGESYKCIEACGVADKVEFLPHRKLYRYLSGDIDLHVAERDVERYKSQLGELFPAERANIERLFAEAECAYRDVSGFLYSRLPFWMRIVATPFLYRRLMRYEHHTADKFFSRFTRNDRLKTVLSAQWTYYGLPPEQLAFPYFSYPFIDYLKYGGYSIKGGSQRLSDALSEVIQDHGGRVVLSSPVTRIHVSGGRVCGVTARKTGVVETGTVISNVSPYTVTRLAGEERFPARFLQKLKSSRLSTSGLQVYLGLDCTLQELGIGEDEYIIFVSHNPSIRSQYEAMMAGDIGTDRTGFSLNLFSNVDPSLAPPGKSTLGVFSLIGGEGWHQLPKAEYRRRKQVLADALIRKAEAVIPGLSRHIEVCEAGSPRTMTKFTANTMGSIYGFEQTPDQSGLFRRFPQRYPLKGLYQVGAWTFPGGGYIAALLSARVLVDRYFRAHHARRRPYRWFTDAGIVRTMRGQT